jgi:apolipoprotein D and lipocalin family protein
MTVIKHFFLILLLTGCAMKSTQIKTVDEVDINRFMGDWYVLAHIPSYVEKNAFNAVESYKLNEDGIYSNNVYIQRGIA